jgi:hypothetical protein
VASAHALIVARSQRSPPACSLASGGRVNISSDGQGTVPVQVQCNQAASAKLTGTLNDKPASGTAKHFTLPSVTAPVHANVKITLRLALPASAMKDLKHGAAESLAMSLTATNANGTGHAALKVSLHR